MSDTKIQWADKVWNPVTGCTKVSAGCRECYAKILHDMRHKAYLEGKKLPEQYSSPFEVVRCHEDRLEIPLHWRKPQRIFVNSMSDLFHPDVPFEFIFEIYHAMMHAEQHTFMILTKRPDRTIEFFNWWYDLHNKLTGIRPFWDYRNIWLGVSVEDQPTADKRIPLLLLTPAVVRFVSCEPLLGKINLSVKTVYKEREGFIAISKLDWVICGGESGKNARPMHPDWARSLRDQCKETNVPFFFKQWGQYIPSYQAGEKQDEIADYNKTYGQRWVERCSHFEDEIGVVKVGKKKAGRLLDGVEHNEYPKLG